MAGAGLARRGRAAVCEGPMALSVVKSAPQTRDSLCQALTLQDGAGVAETAQSGLAEAGKPAAVALMIS